MISPSDEAYSQISFLTPTFLEQPETPIPYQVSWTSHHTKLTYTMEIKFHFFITANIILFKVIITTKLFNQNLQTIFITTAFLQKKEQMLEMQIFYEIPSRTAVSSWWFFFVADSAAGAWPFQNQLCKYTSDVHLIAVPSNSGARKNSLTTIRFCHCQGLSICCSLPGFCQEAFLYDDGRYKKLNKKLND